MEEAIRVAERGAWRSIVLNRPERMNALDDPALEALIAALAAADADAHCRALLITGTGRGFCAGADLASITPGMDLGDHLGRTWNRIARALHSARMPTVCAVNGVAAGAGANLAFGCDIVLAARSARFVQAFAKIGLLPDCGGTWHLPGLLGPARARAVAMLAEPIGAEQAERWGMIWKVVADDALPAEAEALAARLAAGPTQALVLTRRAMAAAATNTLESQLEIESGFQRQAGHAPDFAEGVRAFLEKRPPVFTGRGA